jgi:hypothetical protein
MKLDNGYTLKFLKPGVESPMMNHKGGEIAVDEETKTMYAWEIFVVFYGLESIIKACLSYPVKKSQCVSN